MPKRKFSTKILASNLGFRTSRLDNVDELAADFGLSYSQEFSVYDFEESPIPLSIPDSHTEVIDLMEILKIIYATLDRVVITEDNFQRFRHLRRSLIILLISDSVYIKDKILIDSPDPAGNHTDETQKAAELEGSFAWVDTEIFLVILRLTLDLTADSFYAKTCRIDFPYVCQNKLVSGRLLNKPLLQFNTVELVDCFQLVAQNWHQLHYARSLVDYIDILTCRLASMFFVPQPMIYSGGRDNFETKEDEDTFCINYETVRNIGWAVKFMWRKINIYDWICTLPVGVEHVTVPAFTPEDRAMLMAKCIHIDKEEDLQRPFLNFCLNYILMPGEREYYKATRPFKDDRVDKILKQRRGYSEVLKRNLEHLSGPIKNIALNNALFGEGVSDIALLFLVSFYMSNALGIQFTEFFVIFYDWLEKNEDQLDKQLSTRTYPLILQSFNWFGVYYNGRFYQQESVLDSVLHWMMIISRHPFNYAVDGISILPLDINHYQFHKSHVRGRRI